MKTNKFKFDLRSVALGMALCLALAVLVGSIARGDQAEAQTGIRIQKERPEAQPGMLAKMPTMNDVMAKLELIDQRILILEGKINVVQERCDQVHAMVERLGRGGK